MPLLLFLTLDLRGVIIVLLLFLCTFNYFSVVLYSDLLLQCIHHMINISIDILTTLHHLVHHLIIDQHLIHLVIKQLHILRHFRSVYLTHLLANHACHVVKGVYHFLVILHRLYLVAH